ncbi:rhomboid family intramembrane serine protease [Lacticaseibacillus baoqingensis]|uniref:Rhomboid family intramembrane serine protease n=1 Tax=Lacticaseibacillus baoqingensis TaxID=2486013 RepID=A0ABW4E4L1_9LACO|nr:rhomboid family intramembrane serine protease [Lacticaseibacillus baoqingensis]
MHNPYWRSRLANTPIVTYVLLAITVAVFIGETLMGGSTNNLVLVAFGARWNPLIVAGQWWRFVTPAFVHIGWMHIIVNGISLYYLGAICERIFGHWRFAVIYLVSAIAGNVAGYVFAPDSLSAGASTAIFGLMGAFLMLGDSFRDNAMVRLLSQQFAMLAVINLVFNLFSSGVDITGHIGGLLGGFLVAGAVGAPQLGQMSKARQIIMAVVLVFALMALLLLGRH